MIKHSIINIIALGLDLFISEYHLRISAIFTYRTPTVTGLPTFCRLSKYLYVIVAIIMQVFTLEDIKRVDWVIWIANTISQYNFSLSLSRRTLSW